MKLYIGVQKLASYVRNSVLYSALTLWYTPGFKSLVPIYSDQILLINIVNFCGSMAGSNSLKIEARDFDETNEASSGNTRPRNKRRVLSGLTLRFPNEVRSFAMISDFDLTDLKAGVAQAESFKSDQKRNNVSADALSVAHAGDGRIGARDGVRVEAATADTPPNAMTMVVVTTSSRIIHNICVQRSNSAHSTINNQTPQWQQRRYPQPQQRRHPQHEQHNPLARWVKPPPQQQYWSRAPHQRRQ